MRKLLMIVILVTFVLAFVPANSALAGSPSNPPSPSATKSLDIMGYKVDSPSQLTDIHGVVVSAVTYYETVVGKMQEFFSSGSVGAP